MILDQVMILSYSIVLVYANVYLFKFLKTQEAKNLKTIWKNKKETDQRKIRKRNLVPAEVGLIHTILLGLTYLSKTKYLALCVPSDSDPNFQKSYQNLITFFGEILSNSDLEY